MVMLGAAKYYTMPIATTTVARYVIT